MLAVCAFTFTSLPSFFVRICFVLFSNTPITAFILERAREELYQVPAPVLGFASCIAITPLCSPTLAAPPCRGTPQPPPMRNPILYIRSSKSFISLLLTHLSSQSPQFTMGVEEAVYLAKLAEQAERYEGPSPSSKQTNLHIDLRRNGREHEGRRVL